MTFFLFFPPRDNIVVSKELVSYESVNVCHSHFEEMIACEQIVEGRKMSRKNVQRVWRKKVENFYVEMGGRGITVAEEEKLKSNRYASRMLR